MRYRIKRKLDNKYLKKISCFAEWDNNEWVDDIELSEILVIGKCNLFLRKFPDVEMEIIPV